MTYLGAILPEVLAEYLTDEEVTRAKNLAFTEIMSVEAVSDSIQQYGPQYLNFDRKMSRTEMARRIAAVDARKLREICKKYLVNKEPSYTSWGSLSALEANGGLYAGHKVIMQNMLQNDM